MSNTLDHPSHEATERAIPSLYRWDSSRAFLADPYRFIGKTCQALGTDFFETRLLLQRTVCMNGARAAELFYNSQHMQRAGAAPEALLATAFGKGGVQELDGDTHLRRKSVFTAALSAGRVSQLLVHVRREWEQALPSWAAAGQVSLYPAIQPVLTRAVCAWAGVPLAEAEVPQRCLQLSLLFDNTLSGIGPHLRARRARRHAQAWLAQLVTAARAGDVALPEGQVAHVLTWHRDLSGHLLDPSTAAVELLNLLRPTVAVSAFIVFVAHALQAHPEWRSVLAAGSRAPEALAFVQEVRRHYPFVPAVVARVREDFHWDGMFFPQGRRVLLDLYGTNHDARTWDDPMVFRPERWQYRRPGRFDFVPQGGGDAATNHRCPGEDVTLQLMRLALDMLIDRMRFDVPPQDLGLVMNRLPALPRDGFMIANVREGG